MTYIIGMAHTTTPTRTFTPGTTVDTGHGDYVWTFTVESRTRCFVTLRDRHGDTYRVKIHVSERSDGAYEWALPFGSYSMAPVVWAS